MIRLLGIAFAAGLFVIPLLTTPIPAVAVPGLAGLLLAAGAIATLQRWLATAAAGVFLADYAGALWGAGAPVNVVGAAGFGLGLLFLLESVDLGGRVRGASVDAAVVRSHLGRWIGVGGGTLVTAALAMVLANSLSTTVPPAASPLLAAAGAFGIVLVLAVVIARAGTSRR